MNHSGIQRKPASNREFAGEVAALCASAEHDSHARCPACQGHLAAKVSHDEKTFLRAIVAPMVCGNQHHWWLSIVEHQDNQEELLILANDEWQRRTFYAVPPGMRQNDGSASVLENLCVVYEATRNHAQCHCPECGGQSEMPGIFCVIPMQCIQDHQWMASVSFAVQEDLGIEESW